MTMTLLQELWRLEKALEPGTLLAYDMNGEPLITSHGFPLRALVPGIYGMKNVKWLKRIEVVDYDFQGYWQERGWSERSQSTTHYWLVTKSQGW